MWYTPRSFTIFNPKLLCLDTRLIELHTLNIPKLLPPATKLGQGYVFTGVCDSVHGGEYLTRYTPLPQPGTPPSPPDQVPPRTRYPPWDQVPPLGPGTPPRTRYTPPGPGTPPGTRYTPPGPGTPPWDQVPPRDQVHPPGPGTPPRDQVHPPGPGTPPQDQVPPPGTRYTPPGPGRYGLRAGGTHPTGMHSCFFLQFNECRGQYIPSTKIFCHKIKYTIH